MKMTKLKPAAISCVAAIVTSTSAFAGYEAGLQHLKTRDYAAALREFSESSRAGDARATYQLGKLYLGGLGTKKDAKKAAEYFDSAFTEFQIQLDQVRQAAGDSAIQEHQAPNSGAARIGQKVCRNGTLSYTYQPMVCHGGICTYANMRYDASANDGQIQGNVEQMSSDGMRMQIRISSWASNSMKLKEKNMNLLTAPILDQEIEATTGRLFWDDAAKWFGCHQ